MVIQRHIKYTYIVKRIFFLIKIKAKTMRNFGFDAKIENGFLFVTVN